MLTSKSNVSGADSRARSLKASLLGYITEIYLCKTDSGFAWAYQ